MVFATYGQGHKSGGFNANAGTIEEADFEEEVSDTYEVGFKSTLFDNQARVNATIFYTTFDDFQFSAFNGIEFVVENAAAVRTQGVEADGFAFLPYDTMLLWSAAYTDAIYTEFPDGPCRAGEEGPCDLGGKELAGSPKWTGSLGLAHVEKLGNRDQDVILGMDVAYRSGTFLDADLDPMTYQEAYALVNFWLQLRADDETWNVTFRVENAFDKHHNGSIFDTPVATGGYTTIPGGRRWMTMSARYRF